VNLVDKIKKNLPRIALYVGLSVLAFSALAGLKYYLDTVQKKNLAPNAINLGNNTRVYIGDGLSIHQENIDKDPRKESVFKFRDKYGKEQMVEIYWDENHYPKWGFQEDNTTIPYTEK